MDPQEITKAVKAVLVIASLSGTEISPEHQTAILQGAAAAYGILLAVESWLKRRRRRQSQLESRESK